MNDAEYRAFVAEVCASHEPGEAARLIEAACHPEYRPPLRIDVGQATAAARRKRDTLTGGLRHA